MPSPLLTGLAILGVGGGAAATGGFALPFLTGAGGFSFAGAAAGFGVGGLVAGRFLGDAQAAEQTPAGRAARRLQQMADGTVPRGRLYGRRPVGFVRAYTGIPEGTSDAEWEVVDGIICEGPIDSIVGVQVNDDYLPLTTDNGAAEGLILKSGTTAAGDDWFATLPNDYYVPVPASKWRRVDTTKQSASGAVIHFAIRFVLDGTAAVDTFTNSNAGGTYDDVARKYAGLARFHAWVRGNGELDTKRVGVRITLLAKGANNVWDGSTSGYTALAPAIAADIAIRDFGIPQGDINATALTAAVAVANNTGWDPQSVANKYEFHDLLREDEDRLRDLARVADHMAGAVFERGREVIIVAGGARSSVMSFTTADMLGDGTRLAPPSTPELHNLVVPAYSPDTDDDGKLHGGVINVAPVEVAAYVTADNGISRPVDAVYDGCNLGRRAKFLASILLEQPRVAEPAGFTYHWRFGRQAMRLERMDVIGVTDAEWWPSDGERLFEVVDVSKDLLSGEVEVAAIPYASSVYTPAETVTDEAIGSRQLTRTRELPQITGLAGSSGVTKIRPDGRQMVESQFSWTAPAGILVKDGGSIRIKATEVGSGFKRIATVDGVETTATLELPNQVAHQVQVRCKGADGAVGPWSATLNFTPQSSITDMAGAPVDASFGAEQMPNGKWLAAATQAGVTQGILNWDLSDSSSADGGSMTREATGGLVSPPVLYMVVNPKTGTVNTQTASPGKPDDAPASQPEPRIQVHGGEMYRAFCDAKIVQVDPIASGVLRLQANLYDTDGDFIFSLPIREAIPSEFGPSTRFTRIGDVFQIPHQVDVSGTPTQPASMEIQIQGQNYSGTVNYRIRVDQVSCRPIDAVRGNQRVTPLGIDGTDDWTQFVGTGNDASGNTRPFRPPPLDGQMMVRLRFRWRLDLTSFGGSVDISYRVRLVAVPLSPTTGGNLVLHTIELEDFDVSAITSDFFPYSDFQANLPVFADSGTPNLPITAGDPDESQWKFVAEFGLRDPSDDSIHGGVNAVASIRDAEISVQILDTKADTLTG